MERISDEILLWRNRCEIAPETESMCSSFPPVTAPACRVLVLGSMPGVASLRAQQYYAHPRNAFWPIVYALWGQAKTDALYKDRLAFALAHHIALWDVAQTCQRHGSSDASIRNVQANDFNTLFADSPRIHTILFNGRKAQEMFEKLALDTAGGRTRVTLPSTSPAHTLPFNDKLAAWRILREAAEQEIRL